MSASGRREPSSHACISDDYVHEWTQEFERLMADTHEQAVREFRQYAVRMLQETGGALQEIARGLGVPVETLAAWAAEAAE